MDRNKEVRMVNSEFMATEKNISIINVITLNFNLRKIET